MKPQAILRFWLLGVAATLALANLPQASAADPASLPAAEEAAKGSAGIEQAAQTEWNSREMARSATREIARVERSRAEGALADFRRAGAELDEAGKKRLAAIDVELTTIALKFSQNVLDATNAHAEWIEDEADLAGLLQAAERVFSDRGYHATSIRDIAREAGFSTTENSPLAPEKSCRQTSTTRSRTSKRSAPIFASV